MKIKHIDGRWGFVGPDGKRIVSVGVNTVESDVRPREPWRAGAAKLLLDAGFNTVGAFGNEVLPGIMSAPLLSFLGGYTAECGQKPKNSGQLKLVSGDKFESFCHDRAKERVTTDPSVLGYFLDNELNWNTNLSNFADLVRRYFTVTTEAVHAVAPNALILGCRFHRPAFSRSNVFRVAGKFCDVMSINYYGVDAPNRAQTRQWTDWSGRPYLASEFYAMARKGILDGLKPTNGHGAGKRVSDQAARARWYKNFASSAFADPNCVGIHWQRWADNPERGGANGGIVGVRGTPYAELLEAMKSVNDDWRA